MPVPAFKDLVTPTSINGGLMAESKQERILSLLAMLASGTAPDGTALPSASAAPVQFMFYLDINNNAVWTDINQSIDSFALNDNHYASITTIPVVLPANGYFKASCYINSSPIPPGTDGLVSNCTLSVSNMAGTQYFQGLAAAPYDVTNASGITLTWSKASYASTGTDLTLTSANTRITTTAGGVFVASLYCQVFRQG